jgi:transposase
VDLAKRVIQVHAVDGSGRVVVAKALARERFTAWCAQLPPGVLVAMETCGGAHHWARKLAAMGMEPRLIAGHFVGPYRMEGKRGKNDANDAAAVCEAASRPSMRFVPMKTAEQQALLAVHRLREGFKEERTACVNRIRGLLAEFGLVFAQSPEVLRLALPDVMEDATNELPTVARLALQRAQQQWFELDSHIAWCDQRIAAHALPGFFGPVIPVKMALRQRGAHEEESIHGRADGGHPARGRPHVGGRSGEEEQGQRADHLQLAQALRRARAQ